MAQNIACVRFVSLQVTVSATVLVTDNDVMLNKNAELEDEPQGVVARDKLLDQLRALPNVIITDIKQLRNTHTAWVTDKYKD
jgi:hypothetical protein